MRLIYVFNGRLPTEKAHGLQLSKMCEAFAALGIQTELIVPYGFNPIKEDTFSFYGLKKNFTIKKLWSINPIYIKGFPGRLAFFVQNFSWCISLIFHLSIRHYSKDTIFYARDYVSLFVLSILGRHPIAEIHDYRFSRPRFFIRVILKRCAGLITNSEGTLRSLRAHYDIKEGKAFVAPNGVDIEFFDIKDSKEEARDKLNIPQNQFVISYIGRLETVGMEKGVYCLLQAFGRVLVSGAECTIYIVGGPDHRINEYKNNLKELNIPENKVVFTGQIRHNEIPLYLRAFDVTVIPFPKTRQFEFTASPIKVFEFLAAGKIIIASDLNSLHTHLNESNALFFEPGNDEDLATKITKALTEPRLGNRLSRQARQDAEQYSWEKRAKRILNFINHD